MSIITSQVIEGYEPVPAPRGLPAGGPETAMFRRQSLQPSRRAVLHLQAAGDPAVPSGLGDWFTQRAFHFYLAGLRLPGLALAGGLAVAGRDAGRLLGSAFAGLDAACGQLRDADGIGHVIVAAQGRAALAVALWADARSAGQTGGSAGQTGGSAGQTGGSARLAGAGAGLAGAGAGLAGGSAREAGASVGAGLADGAADALILFEPALPARPVMDLNIACPVLVLTSPASSGAAAAGALRARPSRLGQLRSGQLAPGRVRASLRRHRPAAAIARLGSHVTWLELPEPGEQAVFDELGRWLGAYMYGSGRDRLL